MTGGKPDAVVLVDLGAQVGQLRQALAIHDMSGGRDCPGTVETVRGIVERMADMLGRRWPS